MSEELELDAAIAAAQAAGPVTAADVVYAVSGGAWPRTCSTT